MDIHYAIQKIEERFEYEGDEIATEAWQTLKAAVFAKTTNNTASTPLHFGSQPDLGAAYEAGLKTAQDTVEKLNNSIQQLKAEILPLLTDALDEFADRKFDRGEYYLKQAMAKLSAV